MKALSNWRSVRAREVAIERELRARHSLALHGTCIGLLVLGAMWAAATLQMHLGADSLALRYLITLGAGYLVYLGMLRVWAGALLREPSHGGSFDLGFDLPSPAGSSGSSAHLPTFTSGGGGDFGGGGASADFSIGGDAGHAMSEGLGHAVGGTLEAIGAADEGVVVVVPVVAIFLIAAAMLLGTGSLLLLYFGSDALLAVAIELAFGYVAARTATRISGEGWLDAAVRLTWKPLLGAVLSAVVLGATIDHFLPQAQSLPQAVRLVLASRH